MGHIHTLKVFPRSPPDATRAPPSRTHRVPLVTQYVHPRRATVLELAAHAVAHGVRVFADALAGVVFGFGFEAVFAVKVAGVVLLAVGLCVFGVVAVLGAVCVVDLEEVG